MKYVRIFCYVTLGSLALLFGISIIGWVLYNEFIHRIPEFKRPPLAGVFGVAPVLCFTGYYWLRKPFRKPIAPQENENGA
jgi:membrane protein DedA with SNARE-associated domain